MPPPLTDYACCASSAYPSLTDYACMALISVLREFALGYALGSRCDLLASSVSSLGGAFFFFAPREFAMNAL